MRASIIPRNATGCGILPLRDITLSLKFDRPLHHSISICDISLHTRRNSTAPFVHNDDLSVGRSSNRPYSLSATLRFL